MKPFPRILIAISIIIMCVFNIGIVSALEANEASVSVFLSGQPIYQGSRISLSITFQSNVDDELEIERIGVHFDWMAADDFSGHDYSISPVVISSGGSYTFDAITIMIPDDASVGEHSYYVGIDGVQNYLAFSWDSSMFTVEILDAGEKSFLQLLSTVQNELNVALNVTYESPEAQSLLQQAKDAYTQANLYANDGNYQDAISTLETLSSYLDQAEVLEQQYAEQGAQQQQLLLIIAIIVIAVVVVAVIAVIWRRIRKRRPKVKRPPSKEELTISGVIFSGGDTIDVAVANSGTRDFKIAEVWINNEKQSFTTTPPAEKIPPNESAHVSLTYVYSKGTNYSIKIVSDRKKVYLVSSTAL